jgi:cytochrome P450
MTGTYDFTTREVRDDPHPLFRALREHDPVYDTGYGYWYVSRYDDASALLRDERLVAGKGVPDSLGLTAGPLRDVMDAWMMAIDGAAHARTRRLISRAFTARGRGHASHRASPRRPPRRRPGGARRR